MKKVLSSSTMLLPVPAVLVTVADKEGKDNIVTLAWVGTVNTEPPMISISVRASRHSHSMLEETGEFVVNLPSSNMLRELDLCGILSGREEDKFSLCGFKRLPASKVKVPLIDRCPVNIECKVQHKLSLGSHDIYIGEVLAVQVDEALLDHKGKVDLSQMRPVSFIAGEYVEMGRKLSRAGTTFKK